MLSSGFVRRVYVYETVYCIFVGLFAFLNCVMCSLLVFRVFCSIIVIKCMLFVCCRRLLDMQMVVGYKNNHPKISIFYDFMQIVNFAQNRTSHNKWDCGTFKRKTSNLAKIIKI